MDSRELVELATELTTRDRVSCNSVTVTVEIGVIVRDIVVTSNGDLLRPLHIGELAFYNWAEVLDYIEQLPHIKMVDRPY